MKDKRRKQIFNISVTTQCDWCKHGRPSDIFDGEWICSKDCDEILYPEWKGTEVCPHKEPEG